MEIQACFRHENIAELYGAVLWGETVHLFMEAGEGGSVLEKLESCGPMREFEIIWVTKHVLKGLDFLHSKKVIHHDIKRELSLDMYLFGLMRLVRWQMGSFLQSKESLWQGRAGRTAPLEHLALSPTVLLNTFENQEGELSMS